LKSALIPTHGASTRFDYLTDGLFRAARPISGCRSMAKAISVRLRCFRPLEIGHQSRFPVVPLKFAVPSKTFPVPLKKFPVPSRREFYCNHLNLLAPTRNKNRRKGPKI